MIVIDFKLVLFLGLLIDSNLNIPTSAGRGS